MVYRPQFAYATPPGFRDQDSEQYFDAAALPLLAPSTSDPSIIYNLPLTLDPDAEFRWRGVKFFRETDSERSPLGNYAVRFRDCHLNYLFDDFIPWWLCFVHPGLSNFAGGQGVTHEPEIICPASGVVLLDIKSLDTVPWTTGGPVNVTLCGVKRKNLSTCGCDGQ